MEGAEKKSSDKTRGRKKSQVGRKKSQVMKHKDGKKVK